MFNKELRQRNRELRKTIVDLETSINFKNDLHEIINEIY